LLGRILKIKNYTAPNNLVPTHIEVSIDLNVKSYTSIFGDVQIERWLPIPLIYDRFDLTALNGFTLKETHLPNGTNARMKEILSVMTTTNLADALTDPEMITFRYLVDTFNHGLEPQSKNQITQLILKRQKCFGLLNAPSAREFKLSDNPRFTSTPTASDPVPVLDPFLIESGGNLEENPDFIYTLPEESQGASYAAFFFPNIIYRDDNGKEFSVPPAAYCSNNYVDKYKGNPFLAVAGLNRGVIASNGVAGVEYPLTKEQRGAIKAKGINPIYQKRDGRVVIYGNYTSYTKFKSILNNANARDTLITIEIDQEGILSNYEFEYSDDNLRSTVTSALTTYFGNLRDGFGAIETFELIFDRKNNPDWLVREGASLVDVIVKLPEVTDRFITRITLTRGLNPIVGAFVSI
jgi:hypothetical protein